MEFPACRLYNHPVIPLSAVIIGLVFLVRDYCLLRTGPVAKQRRSIPLYCASVLLSAGVICVCIASMGLSRVQEALYSPRLLSLAIAWHLLSATLCFVIAKRSPSAAWSVALIPAPAPWIYVALAMCALFSDRDYSSAAGIILMVAFTWVAVIAVSSRFAPDEASKVELDFNVRFAALSNSLACWLVPLLLQGS
jgi:hypothetical protein